MLTLTIILAVLFVAACIGITLLYRMNKPLGERMLQYKEQATLVNFNRNELKRIIALKELEHLALLYKGTTIEADIREDMKHFESPT